jgi:competence protein ComEC
MSEVGGPVKAKVSWAERRPSVGVAVALMLGIFAHRAVPHLPLLFIGLLAGFVGSAVLLFRYPRLCTGSILLGMVSAGTALAQLDDYYYSRHHISAFAADERKLTQLELGIDQPPRVLTWPFDQARASPPKQVLTASVRRIKTWNGWVACRGDVLVQIAQPHPRLRQGQVVRIVGVLERPAPAMNGGQFDWAGYYREQRILASVQVAHADNITILEQQSIGPVSWLRQRARQALAGGFAINASLDHALLRALVLGDKDPELRDVQEQFRRTGTSHHLAISGMHVAVLGGVVFVICRLLRFGPRVSWWVLLVFVVLYGLVALPSPPVVRSVVLCASFALGVLLFCRTDAIHLLAISVMGMLIYHPLDLYNAGFQLSFVTVLGLMLFTEPVMNWLPGRDIDQEIALRLQRLGRFSVMMSRLKHAARATVAAALVAFVVSAPLVALHFEQLNPWAIPASIIMAPVVFLALIGGLGKVTLTLLWPGAAEAWANVAGVPVTWMRGMVDWLARFPGADVPLPAPPVWMVVVFYALLLSMLIRWRWPVVTFAWRVMAAAGCLALALIPVVHGVAEFRAHAGELRVTLLAIGAGQCAVVEPPGADAVVIDAGSASFTDLHRKALGPFLRHSGRREIDRLFITHANFDHFSAVAEVVTAYDIEQLYTSPQFRRHSTDNPPAEALLRTLDGLDRAPRQISTGASFDLGGSTTLEVLWPPPDCPFDANNTSLVMRLSFGGKSVLFTADIQTDAQRELLKYPEALKTDVLVAPHHGSLEPTTVAFIEAVSPRWIVSSNDRTLSQRQRLFDRAMRGRETHRTHTSGAITVRISPGGGISIEPFLKPRE